MQLQIHYMTKAYGHSKYLTFPMQYTPTKVHVSKCESFSYNAPQAHAFSSINTIGKTLPTHDQISISMGKFFIKNPPSVDR